MSEGRSIKKFVQLVTIDNNCILLSRLLIQRGISLGFNLGEFTANPSRDVYITPDGLCASFVKSERKQTINFVQKINFFFIDNTNSNRLFNFEEEIFPKKLYAKFIKLKDKEELESFMSEKHGFCVFPNGSEMEALLKEYKKIGVTKIPIHRVIRNYHISKKKERKYNRIIKNVDNKIREVNINFIWEKQQQMKDFVERYLSGNLQEHKLLWLNEQLENTSETLMNKNNYLWKKVDGETACGDSHWDIEKTYGEKDMRNALLVPAYRVYGHYALCCLEIFLYIQNKLPYFVCEKCKSLVCTGKKTKKRFCSKEDNYKCFKKQQNERQRKKYYKKINKT